MSYQDDYNEAEERNIFQKRPVVSAVVGVCGLCLIVLGAQHLASGNKSAPHKAQEPLMIKLPPLPPQPTPPPPPPPPPQQVEQKMIEQTPMNEPEEKPDDKPEAPKAPDVSTGVKGNGPDGFGLSGGRPGGFLNGSGAAQARSRWGWYAGQVQTRIAEALRNNPKTRSSGLRLEVRIWADLTGRVTRARLGGSTGDTATDEAIKSEVLTGLQLQSAPPQGMPMPIVLRITARRPN